LWTMAEPRIKKQEDVGTLFHGAVP
jgi:hypothetical protein